MNSVQSGRTAWLLAVCAVAGIGCTEHGTSGDQVLTGRIRTSGALAVRAISADSAVTAAQVRSDGTFTLALPSHKRYRLEVLTTSGVRHVLGHQSGAFTALSFEVCDPVDPWDVGGIGDGSMPGGGGGGTTCDPATDPNCKMCDPGDPNCTPPQPCDPTDPDCGTMCNDPSDPNCFPGCTGDPMDPNCFPPEPCTDPSDPNCKPDPCADPTDPNCGGCMPDASGNCWPPCQPGDPSCGTICTDPMDPNCVPPPPACMDPTDPYCKCDASGACPPPTCGANDPMCPPPPPPPCSDPTDPNTCKDPCMADPATCGCSMNEPNCWPEPQPPECNSAGMCDPGTGGMTPDNPPGDFGCKVPVEDGPVMNAPDEIPPK
jgi:hypothetical protein